MQYIRTRAASSRSLLRPVRCRTTSEGSSGSSAGGSGSGAAAGAGASAAGSSGAAAAGVAAPVSAILGKASCCPVFHGGGRGWLVVRQSIIKASLVRLLSLVVALLAWRAFNRDCVARPRNPRIKSRARERDQGGRGRVQYECDPLISSRKDVAAAAKASHRVFAARRSSSPRSPFSRQRPRLRSELC